MARVIIRPKAKRDITAIPAYYLDSAGPEIALRFRESVKDTTAELGKFPLIGAPRDAKTPEFLECACGECKDFTLISPSTWYEKTASTYCA